MTGALQAWNEDAEGTPTGWHVYMEIVGVGLTDNCENELWMVVDVGRAWVANYVWRKEDGMEMAKGGVSSKTWWEIEKSTAQIKKKDTTKLVGSPSSVRQRTQGVWCVR